MPAAFASPVAVRASTNGISSIRTCNYTRVLRPRSPELARLPRRNGSVFMTEESTTKIQTDLELSTLQAVVDTELANGVAAVGAAKTLRELENARVAYMGKKGTITAVMKSVGKLPKEDRPKLGAVVNTAKAEMEERIAERKDELQRIEDDKPVPGTEPIDVTLPGIRDRPELGRMHPITSTTERAIDIFEKLGYDLIDELSEYNREIEDDFHCFTALNCPPDHPARDMQDTLYLDANKKLLLRTQTSSMQIRYMMDEDNKPPFAIIAPGRVYRRDSVDSTHTPVFHQIEVLHVRKIGELNVGSLRATIIHFLEEMLGKNIKTRFRGSFFPFTEPSMEVDVFFRGKWLEVLGCGMVDPAVLESVGIDPEEYSGFAAGFGVERFAMVMHQISDIREMYRSDKRFLRQFMVDLDDLEVS